MKLTSGPGLLYESSTDSFRFMISLAYLGKATYTFQ